MKRCVYGNIFIKLHDFFVYSFITINNVDKKYVVSFISMLILSDVDNVVLFHHNNVNYM